MKPTTEFCEDVCDGLIAYYPFFGNTNDTSGNNKNGQIFGDPTFVEDRDRLSNRSMLFDGDDYVIIEGFNSSLIQLESLSVSFVSYFNNEEVIAGDQTDQRIFLGMGVGIHFAKAETDLYSHFAAYPNNSIPWGEYNLFYGLEKYINNYVRFTVTIDKSQNIAKLFINKIPISYAPILGEISVTENRVLLGLSSNMSGFKGKLDELRIYNRALSESEIQQIIGQ